MKSIIYIVISFIIPSLFIPSCSSPVEITDPNLGRIIAGKSVDGVKLGDSRERVEEVLGKPNNITWTDGLYRAWRSYQYKPQGSEGSGLLIRFIYYGENKPWGPVDAFSIHKPYDGKTTEGIGIGSTLDELIYAYGEPDDIPVDVIVDGTHLLDHTYCIDSIKFTVGMSDELVIGFFIGFFIPIEQDETFQCK